MRVGGRSKKARDALEPYEAAGWEARLRRGEAVPCPYPESSRVAAAWRFGYRAASLYLEFHRRRYLARLRGILAEIRAGGLPYLREALRRQRRRDRVA